jgi:hypothetical protein
MGEQQMKCHQCDRPALYLYDEKLPLCLDCYLKIVQIANVNIANLEREMNFALDYMDFATGLPRMGPRYPERKTINMSGLTFHNISIQGSNVGVVNSGHIHSVDIAMTALKADGQQKLFDAFKAISEAVLSHTSLDITKKNEVIEILSVLSAEATAPKEKRRTGAMKALATQLKDYLGIAKDLGILWAQWGPTILQAFGDAP